MWVIIGDRGEGRLAAYHEQRSDDPVQDDAEEDLDPNFAFAENVVEGFELDFAEDGVHHYEQADGFWELA